MSRSALHLLGLVFTLLILALRALNVVEQGKITRFMSNALWEWA